VQPDAPGLRKLNYVLTRLRPRVAPDHVVIHTSDDCDGATSRWRMVMRASGVMTDQAAASFVGAGKH